MQTIIPCPSDPDSSAGTATTSASFETVHADEACIAVLKPAGLLSVPGRGELAHGSLAQRVQCRWPEALVVHRLDMATSGLLLFARGLHWQRILNRMFAQREIDKHYVAVVRGRVVGEAGQIDLAIGADWPNRPRQRVDPQHGKASSTTWQVLARAPDGSWTRLALQPHSGRSHQLRVHLQAIGHPILGDALYEPESAAAEAPRLLLHAEAVGFVHPLHGTPMRLRSPAPF